MVNRENFDWVTNIHSSYVHLFTCELFEEEEEEEEEE